MLVDIRATKPTYISELHESEFRLMQDNFPDFERKMLIFSNNLFKQNKQYVLDYIIHHKDPRRQQQSRRLNILKNIVATKIQEVRAIKRKPRL